MPFGSWFGEAMMVMVRGRGKRRRAESRVVMRCPVCGSIMSNSGDI